jgi:hypothetical protein
VASVANRTRWSQSSACLVQWSAWAGAQRPLLPLRVRRRGSRGDIASPEGGHRRHGRWQLRRTRPGPLPGPCREMRPRPRQGPATTGGHVGRGRGYGHADVQGPGAATVGALPRQCNTARTVGARERKPAEVSILASRRLRFASARFSSLTGDGWVCARLNPQSNGPEHLIARSDGSRLSGRRGTMVSPLLVQESYLEICGFSTMIQHILYSISNNRDSCGAKSLF